MKFIKNFENINTDEFLIAEVKELQTSGKKNYYSGHLYLIETNNVGKCISGPVQRILARIIYYENYEKGYCISATFSLYYNENDDKYYSDFGFIYNILYRTKDKDDAIYNYELLNNANKFKI